MVLGVGKGSEVSSFQRLKEWYLGWEKVERCPQFRSVHIEWSYFTYIHYVLYIGCICYTTYSTLVWVFVRKRV